jgi:hypothetical protein
MEMERLELAMEFTLIIKKRDRENRIER